MQTQTHLVITAVLARRLKRRAAAADNADASAASDAPARHWPPLHNRAALLGSLAPDLPLIAITIVFMALDLAEGRSFSHFDAQSPSRVNILFRDMFFNTPWVKAAQNVFHAPLLTTLYTAIGYWGHRRGKRWGAALFWFGAATCLHSAIDILVHHNDGPLLLFPLEWNVRFYSPVSYWDPRHYGRQFGIFENVLLLGMLLWLGVDTWRTRRRRPATGGHDVQN